MKNSTKHFNVVMVAVLLICATAAHAGTINVPREWATIQQAINNSQPGDEIVVQPGVYAGSIDTFGNSLTIRSSTGNYTDVTIVGDAVFAVYVASFETTSIEDITIENPFTNGRGCFVHNGSTLNLVGCRLHGFTANNTAYEGGAIHVRGGSTLAMTGTLIDDVTNGTAGGGIGITGNSTATLMGCVLEECATTINFALFGGAVYIDASSTAVMSVCDFVNNSSFQGGAIYTQGSLSVTGCSFIGNSVAMGTINNIGIGGAIYINSSSQTAAWDITSSEFISNTAGGNGGAVYCNETLEVTGCTFRENIANNQGGGIWSAFGITLNDSAFLCNDALDGGGLYMGGNW